MFFIGCLKKWPLLCGLLGTLCSGLCRCREVWTKAIVWTVVVERRPLVEVRVHINFTIKYRLAELIWYKHELLVRVASDDMSRRSQSSLHANGNRNINKDFFKTNYWLWGCLNVCIPRLVMFFALLIFVLTKRLTNRLYFLYDCGLIKFSTWTQCTDKTDKHHVSTNKLPIQGFVNLSIACLRKITGSFLFFFFLEWINFFFMV